MQSKSYCKVLFSVLFICGCLNASAQYELLSNDSLKLILKQPHSIITASRINAIFEVLYRNIPGQPLYDSLRDVMITEAETSRDRSLMCNVYQRLGRAYLSLYLNNDNYIKAKTYIGKCFTIANESGWIIIKQVHF